MLRTKPFSSGDGSEVCERERDESPMEIGPVTSFKIRFENVRFCSRSRVQNLTFSNLILKDVTGPISIGLSSRSRSQTSDPSPEEKGFVRNIRFEEIRATVVAQGRQSDFPWPQNYRPGETRQCIVLNGVGEEFLESR